MKYMIGKRKNHSAMMAGFTATTAVILLFAGSMAFSLITVAAAIDYADGVSRHEERIQARLNAWSCLDTLSLMAAKDFFIAGPIELREFSCTAEISNDLRGHFTFDATAHVADVSWREPRDIYLPPP